MGFGGMGMGMGGMGGMGMGMGRMGGMGGMGMRGGGLMSSSLGLIAGLIEDKMSSKSQTRSYPGVPNGYEPGNGTRGVPNHGSDAKSFKKVRAIDFLEKS